MKSVKRGQCRIIAGKWRGRNIKFDDAVGLRPTTDRIRETVFNWLNPYLQNNRCLDAFAGSGVLGFEALSRGAGEVVFVEKNKATSKNLKENSELLGAGSASICHTDVLDWLISVAPDKSFDLVFLDPPFDSDLLTKSSMLLNDSGCLAEGAIIYVEHAVESILVSKAKSELKLPENWQCLKQKQAGQVVYQIFQYENKG